MGEKTKTQKGFISIPIVIGALLVASVATVVTVEVVKHRKEVEPVVKEEVVNEATSTPTDKSTTTSATVLTPVKKLIAGEKKQSTQQHENEAEIEKLKKETKEAKAEAEKLKQEKEKAKQKVKRITEEQQRQQEELERQETQKQLEKTREQQEKQKLIKAKQELYKAEEIIREYFKTDTCRSDLRNSETTQEMLASDIPEIAIRVDQEIENICNKTEQLENQLTRQINSLRQMNNLDHFYEERDKVLDQFERAKTELEQTIENEVKETAELLNSLTKQLSEEKRRKEEIVRIMGELNSIAETIDNQLTDLDQAIKEKEAEIENARNRLASMSSIEAELAQLTPQYNALVEEYNSLLEKRQKVVTVLYKLDDYYNYGAPLSAEDRTFLWSLGISFNL